MNVLRELLEYSGLSFILAAVLAPLLISFLYSGGVVVQHVLMRSKVNEEFIKLQKHKSGTPTMGGLIIAVPFVALALILVPASDVRDVFLLGFVLFALYGLVDELIVKFNLRNKEFRAFQETFYWRLGKLALLVGIGIVVAYSMHGVLGVENVDLLGVVHLPFSGPALVAWGFIIVAGTYGAEITDGLDGLVTGLFLIAYAAYALIAFLVGDLSLLPLIAVIIGPALVYLYFNITPARVFMGGVGAIPLGFGLTFLALVTDTFVPFLVITSLFWFELFSSVIQIVSIRFFGRKVFRIAPVHHHFEAIGWSEPKIVMRFWLAGAVAALAGLWVFTVIG